VNSVQNYIWTKSRNRCSDGISLPKHSKANSQHRQLDWSPCCASHDSPFASLKKLHCSRAYHFAPPQYAATEGCVPTVLCHDICKLAGQSHSTLRQTAISRCTHTGVCVCVCVCVCCLPVLCWTAALRNRDTVLVLSRSSPACVNCSSFHDATAHSGPEPPHCPAFTTLRTTMLSRSPLDK